MAKKPDKITVVALLEVISSEGREEVKSFDKAWSRMLELPMPVTTRFLKFVKIEE